MYKNLFRFIPTTSVQFHRIIVPTQNPLTWVTIHVGGVLMNLYNFIQFGRYASRGPPKCWNVTEVTVNFIRCRNHLEISSPAALNQNFGRPVTRHKACRIVWNCTVCEFSMFCESQRVPSNVDPLYTTNASGVDRYTRYTLVIYLEHWASGLAPCRLSNHRPANFFLSSHGPVLSSIPPGWGSKTTMAATIAIATTPTATATSIAATTTTGARDADASRAPGMFFCSFFKYIFNYCNNYLQIDSYGNNGTEWDREHDNT